MKYKDHMTDHDAIENVKPLAEGVSLEDAICKYQQFKHREGLQVDNWYCTIKIEYCTENLNS